MEQDHLSVARATVKGPSQKFAEAYETKGVRLLGRGVSTVFAKLQKKLAAHKTTCAALRWALLANRLELDRMAYIATGAADRSIECLVKGGDGWYKEK